LERVPLRELPPIAEVVSDLALQSRFQESFRELPEQTTLAGQLQSFDLSAAHQLLDQLVIHRFRRLPGSHL
jgi:hypothetical protein